MVTFGWLVFEIVTLWYTDFLTRKMTRREQIGLVLGGLILAVVGGYSEIRESQQMASLQQSEDFTKGQLDSISKTLGSKLALSPDTNIAVIANTAAAKIDELSKHLAITGTYAVPENTWTVSVPLPHKMTGPYTVTITPNWNTTVIIQDQTPDHFTVGFNTDPMANARIEWQLVPINE